MDLTLTELIETELFVYLDDIVIYANTLEEHKIKFNILAERLRKANLHLQPDKCTFLRPKVGYLGHITNKNGVRPDKKQIIVVKNFPVPKTQKNVKQFLGLAGYYRRFIDGFLKIVSPLNQLLKKIHLLIGLKNNKQLSIFQKQNYMKNHFYNDLIFLNLLYLQQMSQDLLYVWKKIYFSD